MCLGIPVEVVRMMENNMAEVRIGDTSKIVNVSMVEDLAIGEFVILHAGFAVARVSAEEAGITYRMLESIENGKELMFF